MAISRHRRSMHAATAAVTVLLAAACLAPAVVAVMTTPTPPMGWMSWSRFGCEVDCGIEPQGCINHALYEQMTDVLVKDGYLAAGYNGIHIDDCWPQMTPPRDSKGQLVGNTTRFPQGMKALGDYMHKRGVKYALYTAESNFTCGQYPGSLGHEVEDSELFASWGVDYLKLDGCGDLSAYPTGYPLFGKALAATGRNITYSCSWPAYIGDDETVKPYQAIIDAGCNLWRNYDDIECSWSSVENIVEHYGNYSKFLAQYVGPNHFNDPDQLMIGNECMSPGEERIQMAIWSILAAPLIMGNDLRTVPQYSKDILLNPMAIAIDQDPLCSAGIRLVEGGQQIWMRKLQDGAVAVALYCRWATGLIDGKPYCTGITVKFADIGISGEAVVVDVWTQKAVGTRSGSYTAVVPHQDTAFLRITPTQK
eukprot:m.178725 g.178725  ORF g.178725 m.178725 type:complete len:422 (-) comp17398_c1_seq2:3749-5014(-)